MKDTMRAAVFEGLGQLVIKEIEVPRIQKEDEIIIKVELCSICGTDVHIMSVPPGYAAKPGTVLGHELVGTVIETGEAVLSFKMGDRVVTNPNDYCGVCRYCQMNLFNQCENIIPMGIDANGGFAEYVRVSEKVAHKISANLPARIAAFAEPLACLLNGTQKIKAKPGDSVLIIGAGPIGLMFVQMLKASGASPIIVSEPTKLRQEYALKFGADYVVNPLETDLEPFIIEKIGAGVDHVIDVVGSQMSECIKVVRKGGNILLFGVNTNATPVITQSQITFKEVSIFGTWLANATFPKAVQILEKNILNLDELITHVLPLEQTSEGIELLRKGEGIEVLINPQI